ncbi:C-GCAxxG-C-C family protein [Huintestinicola sp.]|uniref:C-GCAxxG-C-C family protein n=1 Tax=Huintestinicola sp. TaxID=2981661 RepID=UPI003D7CB06E
MSTRGDKAKAYFTQGYNCAQSVLMTFSDITGLDEKTSAMLSSGFGGGMGRMREVCGAVSGMFMAVSIVCGYNDPADTEGKKRTYQMIQTLAEKFKAQNKSIICKELLGLDKPEGTHIPDRRTPEYYKKRPCGDLVKDAAEILEEYFVSQGVIKE